MAIPYYQLSASQANLIPTANYQILGFKLLSNFAFYFLKWFNYAKLFPLPRSRWGKGCVFLS